MDWDIHVFSVNIQNTQYRGRKCIKWNKYIFFYIYFLCSNKIDFSILARFNSHGSGQYILMIFSFLQASERLSRRYSCDLCEYAATGENPQNSGHIYTPYTGTKRRKTLATKKNCLQYPPFLQIYFSTPLDRK